MPIVVDPSFVPPPPPATNTSSDGRLTATLNPTWAGVLLKADFSSLGTVPVAVQFLRDGVPVRSGDAALAPGGIAIAYDHEAPLGSTSSWTAVPVLPDGTTGSPSGAAVISVPNPTPGKTGVWMKSILQPSLSRTVWVETPPQVTSDAAVNLSQPVGSAYPVGSWDVRQAYSTSFALVTETAQQRADLEALLDCGPLLYQSGSGTDLQDFYFLPGNVTWQWVSTSTVPTRRWTVAATQVDRPATVDAPLLIPGLSWDSLAVTYASWDALVADKASWAAVLGA